jgi:PIN domain nuclease of toxin-antitoxin system
MVSAISFWEIAMLVARGRLRIHHPLADWREEVLSLGVVEVVVDGATGIEAEMLKGLHRDPADRLIVATALRHGACLVTADQRILAWSRPLARHDART